MSWRVMAFDELPESDHWRPIRHALGIEAFGVNGWRNDADGILSIEHDEVLTGHEELFLVLTGHALFVVDGREIDAPAGTLVHVPDPASRRQARAVVDGTRLLAFGAEPGVPFERSGWEYTAEISEHFDIGDYAAALDLARRILLDHPADWTILYWAGRSAAELGLHEEALDYVRRASELEPTVLDYVGRHEAFAPIRDRLPPIAG
jgi:tetratricopeptide (TPR) repeat protein